MDPLEDRISRLTPEQQREVADFVDFLLFKNSQISPATGTLPSLMMVNTPPVMAPDPVPAPRDTGMPAAGISPAGGAAPPVLSEESSPPLIQEVSPSREDWLTHDYLDYAKYESEPSPATEAVKKVKQKIIARREKEKPVHLLDWVD